ncbi:uncharacterized protein C8R40DRAFT_88626 [Lentinula edodes]|uniref:uncharacterized protein n=1 Tax=Lentinula edodes TaxID=5353 RepID=UPI001E8CB08F|nr:uncharacterized protein C8R40DRAFT_88626 [Lentinula edodes]KAH7877051.1 hypothetical protein C8R40DRAFT_88626 [Lentinula edodes]
MLFLPRSLLRSLCVLVLIPLAILGVWAMPLAPRDALSTIPQLESRAPGGNQDLKLPLVLLRYDKRGASIAASTVTDFKNHDSRIMILQDGEYWVLRLGSARRKPMFFEAKETSFRGTFEIQSRQPSSKPQLGVALGDVTIEAKDEEKLYNTIPTLPWHLDAFSTLEGVVNYLLGKLKEHPLLEGVVYTPRMDPDQPSIFSAMADPNLVHQYPKSLYLKLKPGVTRDSWWNRNKIQHGDNISKKSGSP